MYCVNLPLRAFLFSCAQIPLTLFNTSINKSEVSSSVRFPYHKHEALYSKNLFVLKVEKLAEWLLSYRLPSPASRISKVTPPTTPGPVGDPQPNIVVKKPNQKGGSPGMPTGQGQSTEVPAIASSNPSNFYTLYAKINYNLVN